jgi:hypothetical protein
MRINLITGRRRASLPLSCEGGRSRGDGGTGRGEPGSGEGEATGRAILQVLSTRSTSISARHCSAFHNWSAAKLVFAWACHCELEAL